MKKYPFYVIVALLLVVVSLVKYSLYARDSAIQG